MFKVMVRNANAKSFTNVTKREYKTFAQAAFVLSRMGIDYTQSAAKIVKGRTIVIKRGY